MTLVAYSDGVLLADRAVEIGDGFMHNGSKLIVNPELTVVFGLVGTLPVGASSVYPDLFDYILEASKLGASPTASCPMSQLGVDSAGCMAITATHLVIINVCGKRHQTNVLQQDGIIASGEFVSCGSGGDYFNRIMVSGGGWRLAAELTCQHAIGCGFGIDWVHKDQLKEVK